MVTYLFYFPLGSIFVVTFPSVFQSTQERLQKTKPVCTVCDNLYNLLRTLRVFVLYTRTVRSLQPRLLSVIIPRVITV